MILFALVEAEDIPYNYNRVVGFESTSDAAAIEFLYGECYMLRSFSCADDANSTLLVFFTQSQMTILSRPCAAKF